MERHKVDSRISKWSKQFVFLSFRPWQSFPTEIFQLYWSSRHPINRINKKKKKKQLLDQCAIAWVIDLAGSRENALLAHWGISGEHKATWVWRAERRRFNGEVRHSVEDLGRCCICNSLSTMLSIIAQQPIVTVAAVAAALLSSILLLQRQQ